MPAQVLVLLLLGGLMGLVGQGARSIVGLKKLYNSSLSSSPTESDLFDAGRLLVSLFIGFIAGIVTTLPLLSTLSAETSVTGISATLLAIIAAGYAGTDAVEGFANRFAGSSPQQKTMTSSTIDVAALLSQYSFIDHSVSGNVSGAVVQCTDAELTARGWKIDDDYKMNSYYGFSEQSMGPFLYNIQQRLATLKFTFSFAQNDRAFIDQCIPMALGDLKDAITGKTKPA